MKAARLDSTYEKIVQEVEELMRSRGVSISANNSYTISVNDREFRVMNESRDDSTEFPRLFDNERLIIED